jgi:hypothetical protein
MGTDWNNLFEGGDPFDDPRWREAGLMANTPPRPAGGYVAVSLSWLVRVRPLVRSVDQFLVLLLLYQGCLMSRSCTVTLPNGELAAVGISRQTKYRLLARLQSEGAATIEAPNGKAARVTLQWFP